MIASTRLVKITSTRCVGALIFLAFLVKNLFLLTTNVLFGIFTGVINYYYICSCKKDATWWACTLCTSVNEWPRDVERRSPWPKCYPHFFLSEFIREEGGQGSDSSVLYTNRSGQSRMEVAWDASAWLVAITITLVRVIAFVSSQHRSETKFGRVGGVGGRRRHSIVRLLFATDSRIFCPLREL